MGVVRPFLAADPQHEVLALPHSSMSASEALGYAEHLARAWATQGHLGAKRLALEVDSGALSILACWTSMELGIPLVPLSPGWNAKQRQEVTLATQAAEVAPVRLPPRPALDTPVLDRWRRPVEEESELAVIFTSGSTGRPKAVSLSHRAFRSSARAALSVLDADAGARWGLSLPLTHVGGLSVLTRAAVWKSTVVVPAEGSQGSFDPAQFLEFCETGKVTGVSLVPTQLQRVVSAELRAPAHLRWVLLGGAPSPAALVHRARELGWNVRRTYGLTEACSQVATEATSGDDGSLTLLSHLQARTDAAGRLSLRGESLFSGYVGEPSRSPDEWFVTSDLARLDGRTVTILGRADDVLISGGENIHPAEVEAVIDAAPGVASACCFGRPSPEWGQELCAVLVTRADFSPATFLSYLRAHLPSYKIPKAWAYAAELPLTTNGKVSRSQCRELLASQCDALF